MAAAAAAAAVATAANQNLTKTTQKGRLPSAAFPFFVADLLDTRGTPTRRSKYEPSRDEYRGGGVTVDELPDGLWDRFELWRDVRQGQAGLAARAALSLTAALVLLAGALLVLGLMEQSSHVRDEHVAIALGLASVLWFVALIKIWATYTRFRNVLKTIFGILAIWAVAIPLAILADAFMRGGEEFVIAACILTAICGSILLITSTAHRVRRGASRSSRPKGSRTSTAPPATTPWSACTSPVVPNAERATRLTSCS